jgi:iron-sulfur cluster repair protein YtfE (RIC family)
MKKILILFSFFLLANVGCTVSDPEMMELLVEINNQNKELLAEVKSLQSKSDSLINGIKSNSAKQEELIKKVNLLQGEIGKVLLDISKLSEDIKKQGVDIELIKSQLADLQKKYDQIIIQLEQLQQLSKILAEIENLKGQLKDLDAKYLVVINSLGQNQQALDALKSQVTLLQNQMAQNLTKISELTTLLGQQGVDIGKILAEIAELKKSTEEIKNSLEELLSGGSTVPTNGLVGWWPFNGNANDESGNKLNGVVIGANLTKNRLDQANKAYNFNSTTVSSIKFDLKSKFPNDISNEYTFMIWVKPNRAVSAVSESNLCNGSVSVPMANSNQNWAFIPPTGTNSTLGFGLSVGTNGIFVANHAANLLVSRASFPSQINDFQFVVVSQKSNVTKVYINGKLEKTVSNYCVSSTKFLGNEVELGGDLYSPNFSGIIDDFAVWNRELTADEITKIFNGEKF